MTFHEVQFPTGISYGSRGGPGFATRYVGTTAGVTERTQPWSDALHSYDVRWGIKTLDDLYTVKGFFLARQGGLAGFRFKDWQDYASTADGRTTNGDNFGAADPDPNDVEIGVGDGTTTTFQLVKTYTSGSQTITRTILKPVSGTVRVALGGVEQMSGWTVDTTTGVVTFSVAPSASVSVTAGFEFDVPVFFGPGADQALVAAISDFRAGSIGSIPLIEDRTPTADDGDFWFGGAKNHGTATSDVAVAILDGRVHVFENATSRNATLPDATTLVDGAPKLVIVADGAGTVVVKNQAGTTLRNVTGGTVAECVVGLDSGGIKQWYVF